MASYVIAPQSNIYLIKCPLESDSLNQIDFANATNQYNYFQSLPKMLMNNATYVRKDGRLYFDEDFDTCLPYNYVMYQNDGFSNKWFYAFISDLRYESNNSCSVDITTDVYQTWMFDFTLKRSFIERSHVAKSSDTVGAYTYPEGLETGDYKCYLQYVDTSSQPDCIILASTLDYQNPEFDQTNLVTWADKYNGLYAGCGYYRYMSSNIVNMNSDIQRLNNYGQTDSIICLFMYPSSWVTVGTGHYVNKVTGSDTPKTIDYGIPRIATLDGYTPKNNKLLTYPFCYIMASNGVGTANIYRQEVWALDTVEAHTSTYGKMVMHMDAVLCPGGSAKVYPVNYNGCALNIDEGFTLGKYPQLSFPVDLYTNWEVQNGTNLFGTTLTATESGILGGLIQSAVGSVTGDAGNIAGGLRGIWDTMQEQYRHSLISPTIGGNINCGDVSAVAGLMAFQYYKMGVKAEFAQKIDNFFEMFGYKLNTVAVPNTSSRSKWNYIKTIDVNITGDIPEKDMLKLKQLFNNGFTIWHDTSHFMDYSQTNA